jgi:hypothetical protein
MPLSNFYMSVKTDRRDNPVGIRGQEDFRAVLYVKHLGEAIEVCTIEGWESKDGRLNVSIFPGDASVLKWKGWPTEKLAKLHADDPDPITTIISQ